MARPSQTTVWRRTIITVALLAAFTAIIAVMLVNRSQLRPEAVWVTRSRTYKQQVLAATATDGELKHVEWDGDGWGVPQPVTGQVTWCLTLRIHLLRPRRVISREKSGVFRARSLRSDGWKISGTRSCWT